MAYWFQPRGVAIDFEAVLEDRRVQEMLATIISRGGDLRPALKKIVIWMYGSIAKTFKAQGRPVAWKRLAPLTLKLRRHGTGKGLKAIGAAAGTVQILRDTNRMYSSVTHRTAYSIQDVRPDSLILGTRVPYASKHQLGEGPRTETWQIKEHYRKGHIRADIRRYPRAIKIQRCLVRAHTATFHFRALKPRPFLQWLPEDIQAVVRILEDVVVGEEGLSAAGA